MSILGDNIKLLRVSKKFSQQTLADELKKFGNVKCTRGQIDSYEGNRAESPKDGLLICIAQYFNITIHMLTTVSLGTDEFFEITASPAEQNKIKPFSQTRDDINQLLVIAYERSMLLEQQIEILKENIMDKITITKMLRDENKKLKEKNLILKLKVADNHHNGNGRTKNNGAPAIRHTDRSRVAQ